MSNITRNVLHVPIFVEIVVLIATIILCVFESIVTENYLSSKFSSRLALMFCVMTEIFMFSWLGQRLQDKSVDVCDKIYAMKWQKFLEHSNTRVRKDFELLITITMMRSRRAEVLNAGGFMKLNFGAFMSVSLM